MGLGILLRLVPTPNNIILLITFIVGYVYPTWLSFVAIESPDLADDCQWLTYWVVFTVVHLIEKVASVVLSWIPLYSLLRLVLLTWLAHPQFKGATLTYHMLIRPGLLRAAELAKDVPALAPYARQLGIQPTPVAAKKTDAVVPDVPFGFDEIPEGEAQGYKK